ncbi:MAG: penicillin-binding protein 2 [Betaproteobacteria bacterium]|nr:MAG: penicillin-binding protein 2 [Betaproteobacteria bacterium]
MNYAASPVLAPHLPLWRSRLLLVLIAGGFLVLAGRAVYLQGLNNDFLQQKGQSRYSRVLEISANRGKITDRRGEALAISTPVKSVWAIPEEVQFSSQQRAKLAALLEMPPREIDKRLNDATGFVYLKRQISPDVAERVSELRIAGLFQNREYRRYYPGGEVMAQVLGFTGADDAGQDGIELAFQSTLAGKSGSRRVIKDRLGQIVEDTESIREAQNGRDLALSLDAKLQNLAFSQLKLALEKHKARAGAIVVLDARTGEVLALANLPTYNPNNRSRLSGAQLRNRVITDTFEPGSTLKPFTVALAVDLGRITPETMIATASGSLAIGKATIHDAHHFGDMTAAQVIQRSSNVGAARIALSLPTEAMWGMFDKVGFGSAPRLGFPGEASGKLRAFKNWRPIEQATMSYGHGISVSLLQLAHAYTIFASDGELIPLSLLRVETPLPGRQVISPATAHKLRDMLELAVQPGGTAPAARVMGYRVAGKTGTAHKEENGGYAKHKYVSSFVGLAPASAPRLVIAVMLDEPSAGQYYGGAVAAPVFSAVMGGALRMLGVPPDAPLKPLELPSDGSEIKETV